MVPVPAPLGPRHLLGHPNGDARQPREERPSGAEAAQGKLA
jgi:hypothetical protein